MGRMNDSIVDNLVWRRQTFLQLAGSELGKGNTAKAKEYSERANLVGLELKRIAKERGF